MNLIKEKEELVKCFEAMKIQFSSQLNQLQSQLVNTDDIKNNSVNDQSYIEKGLDNISSEDSSKDSSQVLLVF